MMSFLVGRCILPHTHRGEKIEGGDPDSEQLAERVKIVAWRDNVVDTVEGHQVLCSKKKRFEMQCRLDSVIVSTRGFK